MNTTEEAREYAIPKPHRVVVEKRHGTEWKRSERLYPNRWDGIDACVALAIDNGILDCIHESPLTRDVVIDEKPLKIISCFASHQVAITCYEVCDAS